VTECTENTMHAAARRAVYGETWERIVALTKQGRTATEIADALGVTRRTVVRARRRAGIAQPVKPPLSDEERARARELLDDGASCTEVARTLGRNPKTILAHFPEYAWDQQRIGEHLALVRRFAAL
jgi:DNA-binding CsgD family transcriptional regulator